MSEMAKSKVEAAIFVQCLNSCPQEVAWVESLAAQHPLIKGIVGGLDLTQVKEENLSDIIKSSPLYQDPASLRSQIRSCKEGYH